MSKSRNNEDIINYVDSAFSNIKKRIEQIEMTQRQSELKFNESLDQTDRRFLMQEKKNSEHYKTMPTIEIQNERGGFSRLNSNNNQNELQNRVELLDIIAIDYIEFTLMPKAANNLMKLGNMNSSLEEKFMCFNFILRHYRILPEKMLKSALSKLQELLIGFRDNARMNKLMDDTFNELCILIKNYGDVDFGINFAFVLDALFALSFDGKYVH